MFGDIVSSIEHDPMQVRTQDGVKFLQLSLIVEWQLNNLDASFEKIVGTRRRTVMVYSDLVESTVVGLLITHRRRILGERAALRRQAWV